MFLLIDGIVKPSQELRKFGGVLEKNRKILDFKGVKPNKVMSAPLWDCIQIWVYIGSCDERVQFEHKNIQRYTKSNRPLGSFKVVNDRRRDQKHGTYCRESREEIRHIR